jgi:hypothetical protein
VRLGNIRSWQIGIKADEPLPLFALWLRDVENIEVPRSSRVPGPLDMGDLPLPLGETHDPGLGDEWLTWWESLVDPRSRPPLTPPDDAAEPADGTFDPLGQGLPALRRHAARRWTEFLHWRTAHHRTHGAFLSRCPPGASRDGDTVREVEATLGRKAAPFRLTFRLLPVRDDRIRQIDAAHYLVPERVYLGAGWPAWLHAVVARVA